MAQLDFALPNRFIPAAFRFWELKSGPRIAVRPRVSRTGVVFVWRRSSPSLKSMRMHV
jgi:hypothetical protein